MDWYLNSPDDVQALCLFLTTFIPAMVVFVLALVHDHNKLEEN